MNSPLRFRNDGSFTIVQVTDLHWQDGGGPDRMTRALMATVLDAERPDLVVLTGDVIEGSRSADPAAAWRQAVESIESRGIPWAAVFGNHDDEGSLDRRELMAVEQSCPMCLSESGPADVPGVGNFLLTVKSARGHSVAAALVFVDSGSYAEDGSYACIEPGQIDWFRRQMHEVRGQSGVARTPAIIEHAAAVVPSLVFMHIPLPEFDLVWRTGRCCGSRHEPVNCPRINSGFAAALREAGNVLGVFVGHDHVNDFDGMLDGTRLCYGRATGFNTYGRDGFARGARVIRLVEGERDFATWLRLDDGSRLSQAELKSG